MVHVDHITHNFVLRFHSYILQKHGFSHSSDSVKTTSKHCFIGTGNNLNNCISNTEVNLVQKANKAIFFFTDKICQQTQSNLKIKYENEIFHSTNKYYHYYKLFHSNYRQKK